MRHTIITSTLLAAAFAISPLALATDGQPALPASSAKATATTPQRHHHRHHRMHAMRHGGHHGMHAFRKLDLTDAQRSSIRELTRASFQQAKPAWKALRQKRMALHETTPGSAAYQRAANDLASAEANAASTRVLRRADLQAKIHDILTPAQRTRLADLRAKRIERMKAWRQTRLQKAKTATTTSAD